MRLNITQLIFWQKLGIKIYVAIADIEAYHARGQTFKESKLLNKISQWDSLAIMTFISFTNKKLKKNVNPDSLSKCKTVGDLGKILKLKN